MDTQYCKVIPRDLFNEAKLLKCIGRLCLLIHDGMNLGCISFEYDGEPFEIGLMDEGYLSVSNIEFLIHDTPVCFVSQYNSKAAYCLYAYHEYCEYLVFNEQGNYTDEFKDFCTSLTETVK